MKIILHNVRNHEPHKATILSLDFGLGNAIQSKSYEMEDFNFANLLYNVRYKEPEFDFRIHSEQKSALVNLLANFDSSFRVR